MVHTRAQTKKMLHASISRFNDDLFTEILLRLPAASIFRFKSVSKHWRLLLSQKYFTQRMLIKLSCEPKVLKLDN
ncbi:putative F-box domain-containing protein [Helianthus annuus]|uniref:F-box domain-containing protein n=1 Tax=Helianthus annuus TaxID=4232 RepID=A0A9K3GZL9_HELAN|nr:putative F-box domain-containing protein [Helianthus annuus]KAJ0822913.1 putative F-box domain-containing protein [Helianthus annuus]